MSSSATTRLPAGRLLAYRQQNVVSSADEIDLGDDARLIAQIRLGNREALSQLFRRHGRTVCAIGQRILRDKSEAEDLVQDVFLYIYRRASIFDGSKGTARSWIFQIAYTQAFLRRRELKAQGFYASGIADNSHEVGIRTILGADYDQTVEGLFGRNGWRSMIESLSAGQRETLQLYFFDGCTFAEIAERLGETHRNVRNHYYRGLEKLRRYLAENPLNRR